MYQSKWNKIVEYYKQHIKSPEKVLQSMWEIIFAELFNYSRLEGEIDSFRNINIGSSKRTIPDIIIKNNERDLFIVELKQYNLPNEGEQQLFSYLKLLHTETGILISNKIHLYAYDFSKNDDEQQNYEIEFIPDNPDGIKFIELFDKNNFNENEIKNFILSKNNFVNNVNLIKEFINTDFCMNLLYDYFKQDFTEEEIKFALKEYNINVSKKGEPIVEVKRKRGRPKLLNNIDDVDTDNINKEIQPQNKRDEFIESIKALFPKLQIGIINAYKEVLSDENGINFDYDKLYNLLITEYPSTRPPAPSWFAQKIPEIVFPEKRELLGIKDNSKVYSAVVSFIEKYKEHNHVRKVPIYKIRYFCVHEGFALEHSFKEWFIKLTKDITGSYVQDWLICKNQTHAWLEPNYVKNISNNSVNSENILC